MQSVSPVSGFMLRRGAPRYRSATMGRSCGYCSVYMFLGFCVRKVRIMPFQKSARNSLLKNEFMIASLSAKHAIVKGTVDAHLGREDVVESIAPLHKPQERGTRNSKSIKSWPTRP